MYTCLYSVLILHNFNTIQSSRSVLHCFYLQQQFYSAANLPDPPSFYIQLKKQWKCATSAAYHISTQPLPIRHGPNQLLPCSQSVKQKSSFFLTMTVPLSSTEPQTLLFLLGSTDARFEFSILTLITCHLTQHLVYHP